VEFDLEIRNLKFESGFWVEKIICVLVTARVEKKLILKDEQSAAAI